MQRKKLMLCLSVISGYFLFYFVSCALSSVFWGSLLSPLGGLLSCSILFHTYMKTRKVHGVYKIWLLYCLASILWTAANTLWGLSEMEGWFDPSKDIMVGTLYLASDILLMCGSVIFAAYQLKRWNVAKLILDSVMITFVFALLTWILLFNRSVTRIGILTQNGVLPILSICSDILLIVGIAVWGLSSRKRPITLFLRFVSGGLTLFAFTDLAYYYLNFYGYYSSNTLMDAFYMGAFLLIAAGGLVTTCWPIKDIEFIHERFANSPHVVKDLLIYLCPLLAMIAKGLNMAEFLIFHVVFGIYKGLGVYIDTAVRNAELLRQEKQINNELEQIIHERTKILVEQTQELIKKNEELENLSNKDSLTNLFNRRYFLNAVHQQIKTLEADQVMAFLYIDIDRFKVINDTYGHIIGDKVLIEISRRLHDCAKNSSILARLGGDEFVITRTGISTAAAQEHAKYIIDECSKQISIEGYGFFPAVCIGISMYPFDATDVNSLMKNADIALYHAKAQGINSISVFSSVVSEQLHRDNEIEILLRRQDIHQEFMLYYQPQFTIPDKKLIGAEALIRWNNAKLGMIYPKDFIEIAEDTGHIGDINAWVLQEALCQAIEWHERYTIDFKIGINISLKQINHNKLMDVIEALRHSTQFDPKWLDIEITETAAMMQDNAFEILHLFKSLGLTISIDDYGTGYSSIEYLKQHYFNRIKIAKQLIDNIVDSKRNRQIVQSTILLAKNIGMKTIAEGVETDEQFDILKSLGCDQLQGYLLGMPMPKEEFENRFLAQKPYSDLKAAHVAFHG